MKRSMWVVPAVAGEVAGRFLLCIAVLRWPAASEVERQGVELTFSTAVCRCKKFSLYLMQKKQLYKD